jgi:hypothetical protein
VSRTNARSTSPITGNPAAKAATSHGSISPSAITLPTGDMTAMTAVTALLGAAPASAVPLTMRLTVSPALSRCSRPGPQPTT